jgi:hypothetical protein
MPGGLRHALWQAEAGDSGAWREYSLARLGLLAATLLAGLLIYRGIRPAISPPVHKDLIQAGLTTPACAQRAAMLCCIYRQLERCMHPVLGVPA